MSSSDVSVASSTVSSGSVSPEHSRRVFTPQVQPLQGRGKVYGQPMSPEERRNRRFAELQQKVNAMKNSGAPGQYGGTDDDSASDKSTAKPQRPKQRKEDKNGGCLCLAAFLSCCTAVFCCTGGADNEGE